VWRRVRSHATTARYGHNVLFYGQIGARLHGALMSRDLGSKNYAEHERGTIYLQGSRIYDKRQVSIKYYHVGRRDHHPEIPLSKLEVTFYSEYFRRRKIAPYDLGTQPAIQAPILPDLSRYVARVLEPEERIMWALQTLLNLKDRSRVVPTIL
jgi:hypothetical protein